MRAVVLSARCALPSVLTVREVHLAPLGRPMLGEMVTQIEPDRALRRAARCASTAGDTLLVPCPIASANPWASGAAAPFLWIETAPGNVEVWALGEGRFGITAPGYE